MMEKINLNEKFSKIEAYWSPKIVAELNGQYIKVVKLKGEFIWHFHQEEDELFMVLKGRLSIKLRDSEVVLNPGEFFVVPHGIEHKPVAYEDCHVMMFEPQGTLNTGNVRNDRTMDQLERI
jgi:mannose-6-phosphate isomerase-like protein (cupin superfamily)